VEAHVDDVAGATAVYEDEISLLQVASLLLRQRRLIVGSTFIGSVVALVMALMTPTEFTSTASGTDLLFGRIFIGNSCA
jgi:uncharacterized protein involved in exopolysaccharide biosynthesis